MYNQTIYVMFFKHPENGDGGLVVGGGVKYIGFIQLVTREPQQKKDTVYMKFLKNHPHIFSYPFKTYFEKFLNISCMFCIVMEPVFYHVLVREPYKTVSSHFFCDLCSRSNVIQFLLTALGVCILC